MTLKHSSKINKRNLKFSQSKESLSNDAGSALIQFFMINCLNIKEFSRNHLPIQDERRFCFYSNEFLFLQVLTLLIQGYHVDAYHSVKRTDEINKQCWGGNGASQPTVSRFLKRLSQIPPEVWNKALLFLTKQFFKSQNYRYLVLDIDSTHFDTYGHQEKTAFNSHYGTMGYHPLIITETQSGLVLPLLLRYGERYTSYNAEKLLKPLIELLKDYSLILRGDSGFATPDIYALSEEYNFNFVIRLKKNARLNQVATEAIDPSLFSKSTDHEVCTYEELDYKAKSWEGFTARVVSEAKRLANELIFNTTELVTSLEKASIEEIFRFYRQRGEMENIIKELKEGFAFGKTDSSSFEVNQARMYLSAIAYNIVQLFKRALLSRDQWTGINRLRFDYFHIGGRIVKHAHQITIVLSANYERYKEWASLMMAVLEWQHAIEYPYRTAR